MNTIDLYSFYLFPAIYSYFFHDTPVYSTIVLGYTNYQYHDLELFPLENL